MTELEQYLAEKNTVEQRITELAKKAAVVSGRITIRKADLAAIGRSPKQDDTYLRMKDLAQDLNTQLAELHRQRKQLNKEIAALKAQEPKKPPKPRGARPGNRVYMGSEFKDCNGFERRLALLMAYEIGQERYNELRRQAGDDTRDGETLYYTGPRPAARWDDACRRPEEDFEKMMRTNRNSYAGREI